MPFRLFRAVLAGLLLFVLQPVVLLAQEDASQLPLWEIRQVDGPTVYLMGSVHLLRPEVYPLDEGMYEAFDDAEVVAFELDFREMMAAAAEMAQRGMFSDGRGLADVVPQDVYEDFVERISALGMPAEMASNFKPWLAALTVSAAVLQAGGYEMAAGIDHHFFERAMAEGKTIVGFETMEEQIEVFDGLDDKAQAEMLRSTLNDLDDTVEMLDQATAYWQRGEAEPIAEMFTRSMQGQPELLERLLFERNRNWIPQIEALLVGDKNAIVIVGMGHLVGEQSVIEMLEGRGHVVIQHEALGVVAH